MTEIQNNISSATKKHWCVMKLNLTPLTSWATQKIYWEHIEIENMNIQEEIRELEKQGVFIHYMHEHYTNGSNCSFSIEFTKHPYPKHPNTTKPDGMETITNLVIHLKYWNWRKFGTNWRREKETLPKEERKKDEFYQMLNTFPTYKAAFSEL